MYFEESYGALLEELKSIESVGVDCRLDQQVKQIYREAKDARADARQIERQFYLNEGEDTSANYWKIVANHSLDIILHYSRDVEVMAWLLESLCRLDAYEGCSFGFDVIAQAIASFGSKLYPQLDDEDPEDWQWISLTGLNGEDGNGSLISPLNNMCICTDPAIHLWEYQRLIHNENTTVSSEKVQELTLGELHESIKNAGQNHMLDLLSAIHRCIESFSHMNDVFWDKLSDLAPPTSSIKKYFEVAQMDITRLAKNVFGESIVNQNTDKDTQAVDSEVVNSGNSDSCFKASNRDQAIQKLHEVARFFQNVEPHSPIPYMLYRVIDWSKMSWPELMATMINNEDEINHIIQQTGMPVHQEGS
jgi:type VI secretion system protein ImpA